MSDEPELVDSELQNQLSKWGLEAMARVEQPTMRAIEYAEHGGPSVLKYRTDIPIPCVGDTQVLVRVSYAGVNPVDAKLRDHPIPRIAVPKPKIPGADIAGEIVNHGSRAVFRKGSNYAMLPMIGTAAGGYADYVSIDQSLVSPVPANVSLDRLAGMPLVGLTVLQAFDKLIGPLRGKKILIHAGAGGLGSVAIQYATNHLGMRVATTCGPDNLDFVRDLGAEIAINYRGSDSRMNSPDMMSSLIRLKGIIRLGPWKGVFSTRVDTICRL